MIETGFANGNGTWDKGGGEKEVSASKETLSGDAKFVFCGFYVGKCPEQKGR